MIIYGDEDAAGAIKKFKKKGNLTGQLEEISEKGFHFHWNSFHYFNKKVSMAYAIAHSHFTKDKVWEKGNYIVHTIMLKFVELRCGMATPHAGAPTCIPWSSWDGRIKGRQQDQDRKTHEVVQCKQAIIWR